MNCGPVLKYVLFPGLILAAITMAPYTAITADIPQNIEHYQTDIKKLHKGIQSHLDKLQKSGEKEFSLLGEIELIDTKLNRQKDRLDAIRKRLHVQEQQVAVKENELEQAAGIKKTVQQHLEKRLRAFYLINKTGLIHVSFSAQTLPDLMLFHDSFMKLLEYDHAIIVKYRNSIELLRGAKEAHELESSVLRGMITQAVHEKKILGDIRQDKKKLLTRIKTQKGLYEQALKEMKKAETDLKKTMHRLRIRQDNKIKGFVINKGRLQPPVHGHLVSRFGETENKGPISNHTKNGITIKVKDGEPVRAVFDGKVIFVGYKRGYGNMVVIDHGLHYLSVTARLEKINVKEGETVAKGDVIGTAGDIATLFANGLYFEIRHETKPLDPLKWFNSKNFSNGNL